MEKEENIIIDNISLDKVFQILKNLYDNKEYKKVICVLEDLANEGYKKAQLLLAYCYAEGSGVIQDDDMAVYWLQKAEDISISDIQYHFGNVYEHGEEVIQDYVKALKWYKKSAEQGNKQAIESCNRINDKLNKKE